MSVVEALLDSAYQDTQLLIKNNEEGDNFNTFRDVDFIFYTDDAEKADIVSNFINDNEYGSASFKKDGEKYIILVIVNMPSTQNIVCAISGLFTCLAQLFDVSYDGWGCVLQNN